MTTAASTPCTDFVAALLERHLIDEDQSAELQQYLKTCPPSRSQDLADHLVQRNYLTRFQADTVQVGRVDDLILSNFRLTEVLGSGSMGTVYKARSINDPGWYAIKVVPRRNVVSLKSVVDKVKSLKQIRHPRVSALVQVGAQGERVYLAWPYLEGGQKLDEMVEQQGPLPPRQVAQIALQVASGLQVYHQHGLFHGLLKPSDIVIGSDKRVRILDLGVGFVLTCERGKSLLDTMTNTKTLARGLDCAAPETNLNPLDRTPAGDRYSLGCILFYCLTGQYPFPDKNPLKKMLAHQGTPPPDVRELNPAVSAPLAAIVDQLLSKNPDDRYYTTDELVEVLRQLLAKPGALAATSAAVRSSVAELEEESHGEKRVSGGVGLPVLLAGLGVGLAAGCAIAVLMARG